jgi:protein-L-isoaspartate(D-aspartate) O-methyltransferase
MNSADKRGIGMTSARTRERLVNRLRHKGIGNVAVLNAIRNTPRHLFVDEALSSRAYEDTALPIGHGQTISQPYVVAWMTAALLGEATLKRVLEVGTGCGYQTAVLASLVTEVYTVERVAPLLRSARQRLRHIDIHNVHYKHSDGSWGWPAQAPYDGILVTAAPEEIPSALLEQLAVGGRMVIPVGRAGGQELTLIERTPSDYRRENLGLVSFVPLVGGEV